MTHFLLPVRLISVMLLLICFLSKAEGRDLSVILESDSVEIGQLIRVNVEGEFPDISSVRTPGWELVSASAKEVLFQIFEPGTYPLPVVITGSGEEIQLMTDSKLLIVTLPRSVEGEAVLRSILGPVAIRQGWLVRWRVVLTGFGAIAFILVLLLAAIRSAGPVSKLPPPPSALFQIRSDFEAVRKLSDHDVAFSETQALFRRLLATAGVSDAASAPLNELVTQVPDFLPVPVVEEVLLIMRQADEQRFNGGAVTASQLDSLQSAFATLLAPEVESSIPKDPSFDDQYGSAPKPFPRILAGLLDLLPLSFLFLGLSGFPELHASLPWNVSGNLTLILGAVLMALLCKSLIEWLGTTSTWQASPGMKCMNLAVVSTRRLLALRAGGSLLASIPIFAGHAGIFLRSRQSIVDRISFSQLRQYSSAPHE